jgi:hypothetical protein
MGGQLGRTSREDIGGHLGSARRENNSGGVAPADHRALQPQVLFQTLERRTVFANRAHVQIECAGSVQVCHLKMHNQKPANSTPINNGQQQLAISVDPQVTFGICARASTKKTMVRLHTRPVKQWLCQHHPCIERRLRNHPTTPLHPIPMPLAAAATQHGGTDRVAK